jgi:6-phosphogluconolactonase/glucosamine-6-phosphate isomerase/deaminase
MKINTFRNSTWSRKSSSIIIKYIKNLKLKKINILLTGGKSASKVYNYLFSDLRKINKYFSTYLTDERCVDFHNTNSNFYLINKKLKKTNFQNMVIFPILNDDKTFVTSAADYIKKIPIKIDLLLLSVGQDGHVASIFERDWKKHKTKKKVIFIKKEYNKFSRITITWQTIKLAKKIFIFCKGYKRGKIFFLSTMKKKHILRKVFLSKPQTFIFFDKSAYLGFREMSKKFSRI